MKTTFAVIGAGQIGQIHAASIASFDDAEISWVVDADGDRAGEVAARFGSRATCSAEEAISDPDVDAVIVSVPTHLHRSIVELAAGRKKHILCEKPIAPTVSDGTAMIRSAERAGVRLMIGHVVRHFPEYAKAKKVLEDGTLGIVGTVRASRVGSSPVGSRPWLIDPAAGGGVVVDLMIHELDTLRWYFGELSRVYALRFGPTKEETPLEYVQAVIRFECGIVAHCVASWAHYAFRTRLEIAGEHGLLRHDSQESLPIRNENAISFNLGTGNPTRPYENQLRHFIDCVRNGNRFLVEGSDGISALAAALAVAESSRTGSSVTLAGEKNQPERSSH